MNERLLRIAIRLFLSFAVLYFGLHVAAYVGRTAGAPAAVATFALTLVTVVAVYVVVRDPS